MMKSLKRLRMSEFRRRLSGARPRLFRTAYAWTHDRDVAEDLVHEAFAKALRNAGQLREPDALEAWLFRIMTNCWHDHLRQNPATDSLDRIELTSETTPEVLHSRLQIIERVRHAVAELPQGFRETVTLVDIEGFSYADTANILDVPVGTVMSRLSRGRARLLAALRSDLDPPDAETGPPRVRRIK